MIEKDRSVYLLMDIIICLLLAMRRSGLNPVETLIANCISTRQPDESEKEQVSSDYRRLVHGFARKAVEDQVLEKMDYDPHLEQ